MGVIQPSLRDSGSPTHNPTLERVGYYQISLREMAGSVSRREMVTDASRSGRLRTRLGARWLRTPPGRGDCGRRLPEGESIIAQQFTAGLDSRLHKSRRDG